MQKGYTNNINFKITFTGMMLALVILFQYLEQFMPIFHTFMNINLSIIFIMTTLYIVGFGWSISLILLRFIIGPSVGAWGYSALGIWSQFILLVMGFIFMMIFWISHKFIFKNINNEPKKLFITSIVSILITSFLGALFNGILFTPMFWYISSIQDSHSIYDSKITYSKIYIIHFFGISNYWIGMFVIFGIDNIIKYTIISFSFISLWKIIKHYKKI